MPHSHRPSSLLSGRRAGRWAGPRGGREATMNSGMPQTCTILMFGLVVIVSCTDAPQYTPEQTPPAPVLDGVRPLTPAGMGRYVVVLDKAQVAREQVEQVSHALAGAHGGGVR